MNENRRIVINTTILYAKLGITTVLGLLSSRYILLALGSSDFGLYSIVGGIVTFLNVIGVTMVSTSYRFLAVGLGSNNVEKIRQIYSSLFLIHIILSLFLIVVGELLGVYYIDNHLVVEYDRLADARFVFHVSLLTTALTVINVPANGLIIAKEKFLFTSIVEILVASLKFIFVIFLINYDGDKLRLYAIIILLLQFVTTIMYQGYCYIHDKNIISFKINRQIRDYKDIIKFTIWSLLGASAYIGSTQGAAIVINLFFGTVLNAAYGIASQVNSYANTFIKGITQATIPQIMKSYGSGNHERSLDLVYNICRISSLIFLIFFVPMLLFTKEILGIWLGNPPLFAVEFVVFLLISSFISVLGSGFDSSIQSTGQIRNNEVVYSFLYLLQLPGMYIAYKIGAPPFFNVILLAIVTLLLRTYQMYLLRKLLSFDTVKYLKESVLPVLFSFIIILLPFLVLKSLLVLTISSSIVLILLSVLWAVIIIVYVGLKRQERDKIYLFIKGKLSRNKSY